jgi:GH24 family phage-related lysozyme (muramidase)
MKNMVKYTLAGVVALLLIANAKKMTTWYNLLRDYFTEWEGFSSKPYWDYKQWSWGYGTRVPGSADDPKINPGGTISRLQGFADSFSHADNDYHYLKKLITVPLTGKQWAALLSFSYNLGRYSADNLVANINAQNWPALRDQWLLYNKAGGKFNQHLADRRLFEVENFLADV